MHYKNFREYYETNILKESPLRGQFYIPTDPDNINVRIEWAKDIKETANEVDNIKYFGLDYYIYEELYDDKLYYYILDSNKYYLMAYMFFDKNEYGYTIISMWKTKESPIKTSSLLVDYFLPKFGWIFSSADSITNLGELFWKRFIKTIDQNKFSYGLLQNGEIVEFESPDFVESEDLWHSDHQIWIKRK